MRKGRSLRVLSIIALVVAITGLTIAFIVIHRSLKDGEDSSCLWNIQFKDLKAEKSGSADYHLPVVSDTSLQGFQVELKKPGDAVHLSFKVTNKGSFDALLSTIYQSGLNCKVEGSAPEDICSKIQTTLQYEDGNDLAVNDLLNHDGEKRIQFSVVYPMNASPVEGKVVLGPIHLFLIYKQNV